MFRNHIILVFCILSSFCSAVPYSKQLVNVPLSDKRSAKGYLLRPDSCSLCPAVLLLHDHGAWFTIGKEKMVAPIADSKYSAEANKALIEESEWFVERCYDNAYLGDTLASRGYVVLCIDALFWGERAPEHPSYAADMEEKKAYNNAMKAFQPKFYSACVRDYGRAWYEQVLLDDKACVTYLLSQPYVDKSRVGCFGFSFGAYRAWQLAAEDMRLSLCAAANWMTTKKSNGVLPNPSAYSMFRPAQPFKIDYPDVASLIAPRPFLLIYGTRDHLFDTKVVEQCVEKITDAYKKSGSETAFRAAAFDDDHFFGAPQREELLRFLKENL